MNDDQDYKVITTPAGKQVKIRTYTTGADEEAIKDAYAAGTEMTIDGDGEDAKANTKVDISVENKVDRIRITRFVVDIDGAKHIMVGDQKVALPQAVYELRSPDFHAILDAVKEVTKGIGGLKDEEKKD